LIAKLEPFGISGKYNDIMKDDMTYTKALAFEESKLDVELPRKVIDYSRFSTGTEARTVEIIYTNVTKF
jgi:hypothetical protein